LSHQGPASVVLPRAIAAAITAQARAESPNEACGLVIGSGAAGDGGIALRYEACRNAAASPVRYTIHPEDLLRISIAADDDGEVFWGIVHSHVRSPAVPSLTDIGLAFYPDALYILVSLADGQADPVTGAPSLRAWRILGGIVQEVPMAVA
jgi:proteasome lid subunit RPN8/RPN11